MERNKFKLPDELFNKKTFKRTKQISRKELNNILKPGMDNFLLFFLENKKQEVFHRMNMMRKRTIRSGRNVKDYIIEY